MLYTFENECGDMRIITGDINWGDDFKWTLGKYSKKKPRDIEVMPLGEICRVKSSEYDMRGFWKLVEIN